MGKKLPIDLTGIYYFQINPNADSITMSTNHMRI